jgi:two-component system response regulator HydG
MMSAKSRILVVDDNEDFCHNVTDILGLSDYEVVTTSNGFKALEMVEKNGFDLVLMDIKMPGMDGVETFKKIKEIAPTTPVIMVTAYAVEDLVKEALREGAFGALKKPLDFDRLFKLIEAAIAEGALILVVDDDENLCTSLKASLSEKGNRVSIAYDGNTAIEKAHENNFDIILIELRLPVLNGLETYLAIREIRPKVAAIITSSSPQEMSELAQQALLENAYACLEKPIDMDKLTVLLEQIKEQKARGILENPDKA